MVQQVKILYPGCRARILYMRETFWKSLTGREVTVLEKAPEGAKFHTRFETFPYEWLCSIDGYSDGPGYFLTDQLEPIVPDKAMVEEEKEKELETV